LAICARDSAELDRARIDLERRGYEVLPVVCDVTDQAKVAGMVLAVIARYARIDVLVNNAGAIHVGPVESMQAADFKTAMDVIFWGTLYPILEVMPSYVARQSGKIVNISSIGGKVSVPHLAPYSAAKFAVAGLSEGLRSELGKHNITVTAIFPGLMRTGSTGNAHYRGDRLREAAWFSTSATLPGLTLSAQRAAHMIADATRDGVGERVLGAPAWTLERVHSIFPAKTIELIGTLATAILPMIGSQKRIERTAIRRLAVPALKMLLWAGKRTARNLNQGAA
jgi:NADP-dependent 3-hydroxy acid dehydrogenase YdfG